MNDAEKLIYALREARRGCTVLIVGEHVNSGTYPVGPGVIFLRKWAKSGLRMIRVDHVIFLDEPPEEIREQAISLLKFSEGNYEHCIK